MLKNSNTGSEKNSTKYNPLFGQNKSLVATEIKSVAGVMAGAFLFKRFPKIAAIGLIGVGVIIGLTLKEVARSVDRFPRSRDDLH